MKIKFNRYERVAGMFVVTAIGGALVVTVFTGLKRGWFEAKTEVVVTFKQAEGLYSGTAVQMAGLRAGTVEDVSLTDENHVRVRFSLKNHFFERVKKDSHVQVIRPFIIGEKLLDVSVGTPEAPALRPGEELATVESMDIMDFISGKTLGPQLATMAKAAESLRKLLDAFADPTRMDSLIHTLDSVQPMVSGVADMSKEVVKLTKKLNRTDDVEHLVRNATILTSEMNKILPDLNQSAPHFGQEMGQMLQQVAALTNELSKLTPILQEMGPEMPRVSRRAIEALDEAVVTLKAIQRTFLVRSAAKDVREEEKKEAAPARTPASEH